MLHLLIKAKRGETKPGHKYESRKPDPKHPGEYIYTYKKPSTSAKPRKPDQHAPGKVATFYATIDSDSVRNYMPATPVLLPVSSWVRKAKLNKKGMVAGAIPAPKLPAHLAESEKGADGGGFVAARKWNGEYIFTVPQYVAWLKKWQPTWAAMLDYCVEPQIAPTADDVEKRQQRTTERAHQIWRSHKNATWAWVPTVQGWTIEDYQRHAKELAPLIAEMREHYGSDSGFRVGIGTLCCRTNTKQIRAIVQAVAEVLPDVPLHLWGVKLSVFKDKKALHPQVISTDSAAWSGRFGTDIEAYRESGLPQREHAYKVALPAYQAKIAAAQAQPKQAEIPFSAALYDWNRLAPADKEITPPPMFSCSYCDTSFDWSDWDFLDDEEQEEITTLLGQGNCPACTAPLDEAVKKDKRTRKSNAAPIALVLMLKGRRDEQMLGHQYWARKRSAKTGRWIYSYKRANPRRTALARQVQAAGFPSTQAAKQAVRRVAQYSQQRIDKIAQMRHQHPTLAQLSEEDRAESLAGAQLVNGKVTIYDNTQAAEITPGGSVYLDADDAEFMLEDEPSGTKTRSTTVPLGDLVSVAGLVFYAPAWVEHAARLPGSVRAALQGATKHRPAVQQSLDRIEEQIRHLPKEVAHVLDADGNELLKLQGEERHVSFADIDKRRLRGAILTHNHPINEGFSEGDIKFMVNNKLGEMRAVTATHKHRLRPTGIEDIEWPTVERIARKIRQAIFDELQAGTLDRRSVLDGDAPEFAHIWWSRVAAELGWHYSREAWTAS